MSAARDDRGSGKTAKTIKYTYFANVAYALCEGPIDRVGTIWADGKKLKKGKFNFDVYRGTETQGPELADHQQGDGRARPAYRGTAYVVFENMPLESFGNRLPQLNFEVFRSCRRLRGDGQGGEGDPGLGRVRLWRDR